MTTNLLSPQQTAEMLRVTPETLAVWRCTGRYNLTFIKVGRKVLYEQRDIEQFIESRRAVKTT